ncbi:hypothetical protein AVEN_142223-1 [Araneus ventricosus]|uniref:DUF4817 domain-containing protein n=1 Tax=Araneus ventricosus TaxID=182803 RepID=A0A4Y2KMY6_ARAVE|nr:hypothetical protein AVEN_142223-1 [Araneus ventricosus]
MDKYSTYIRVFLWSKHYENAKAVQQSWQEEFHNKHWPDKRAAVHMIDCDGWLHVMDGFQKRIADVLVKEGGTQLKKNLQKI